MYYIYHIPDFKWPDGSIGKIGCTKNKKHRIEIVQQYKEYEILEEHLDINIASDREIILQKQYGYKIDSTSYKQITSLNNRLSKKEMSFRNKKAGYASFYIHKKGLATLTKEQRLKISSDAGKIGGNKSKEKLILQSKTQVGEKHPRAKLTNLQAEEIRNQYVPKSKEFGRDALAKKYNVSLCVIKGIISNTSYKK
jgi:hypothetical protein